jgi:hypothetical protein
MPSQAARLGLVVAVVLAGPAAAQTPAPPGPAPWGALTDVVKAGEIVLGDVCLPGILERKPIEPLALNARLVAMPPRSAGAGAADKVWRLGSLSAVYAVAWADGSCSTYVERGSGADLRAMAERVILARPEGFVRGRSGLADGDRVERTVYCAQVGDERLVASITTPNGRARQGTRALSSTVYRARGPSALCAAQAGPD